MKHSKHAVKRLTKCGNRNTAFIGRTENKDSVPDSILSNKTNECPLVDFYIYIFIMYITLYFKYIHTIN